MIHNIYSMVLTKMIDLYSRLGKTLKALTNLRLAPNYEDANEIDF